MSTLADYRVEYIGYDDNHQDEYRVYWFNVDNETYGVSHDSFDEYKIVDSENYPVNTDDWGYQHLTQLIDLITEEMEIER